ncbi:hypothetical protein T484DRAFT_1777954 [Baffinella frigidus]|nr:hypothetical protein T484DRAFT_1777954 [Cryptophyta sp. CCMP2293]
MAGVGSWARRPGTWAAARSSPGTLARLGGWLAPQLEGGRRPAGNAEGRDWLRTKPRTPHTTPAATSSRPSYSPVTRAGDPLPHAYAPRAPHAGAQSRSARTGDRALHASSPMPHGATASPVLHGATAPTGATAEADAFLARLDAARPGIFLGLAPSLALLARVGNPQGKGRMSYGEGVDAFLARLDAARPGIFLGLAPSLALLARVGNPQETLRVVHVAGTNGKGSICAMVAAALRSAVGTNGKGGICAIIAAALRAAAFPPELSGSGVHVGTFSSRHLLHASDAGVRVGTFSSPHLLHASDAVTIDGSPDPLGWAASVEAIRDAAAETRNPTRSPSTALLNLSAGLRPS